MILCCGDTLGRYKLSHISPEFGAIFDESYSTKISEMYAGATPISYTKVTLIHYYTLSKKILFERLTLRTCLFVHYKIYYHYLFLTSLMTLSTKMKLFTALPSRKLTIINGFLHHPFAGSVQGRYILPSSDKIQMSKCCDFGFVVINWFLKG